MRTRRNRVLWLTAVLLALAGGVVLGSGALSGVAVTGLRGEKGDLQDRVNALTDQNDAISERLLAADQFDSQMAGRIVRDALAGTSVIIVRTPDAEDADVEAVVGMVGQAGGSVTGTIGLTTTFVEGNAGEKLATVVNSPILPPGTQLDTALTDPAAQAGDLLGIAMLVKDQEGTPVDDGARDTVLAALRDTGFLDYGDQVGAARTAVVITGGALPEDAGNQGATVARFTAALAPHGAATVLAGRDGSASGVASVALTRADPAMSRLVTTVDDVGSAAGRITSMLALQAMLGGLPPAGYGVGQGASAVTVPQ